jgi:hypothetical protein
MHRPATQTLSPAQAPHSSAPPGQPLPILPQYWPPEGVQVTDGVHAAASLPAPAVDPAVPGVVAGGDSSLAQPDAAIKSAAGRQRANICDMASVLRG